MRRVMKSEVSVEKFIQLDGLEYCIACWKDYMMQDDRDLSASRMNLTADVPLEEVVVGYESDPFSEQRIADMKIGRETATVIHDLPKHFRWAIQKMGRICLVWNCPRLDYAETLISAKIQLEEKLRKNKVTSHKF